jgi:hypothetical protein
MKNNFVYIAILLTVHATALMGQSGFEQYYYLQKNTAPVMVPIVHVQSDHGWYTEVRYNYEEQNSLAVYGGKCFDRTSGFLSYSLTPIVGGVLGQFNGGSIGLNASIDYNDFFFVSQSQFTFSSNSNAADFFFGWYELGYAPLSWFSFGCSVQHTMFAQSEDNQTEPGIMLGFNVGKWSFPIYTFNPLNTNPYFVLGVTHVLGLTKK